MDEAVGERGNLRGFATGGEFVARQVAEAEEQIVDSIEGARLIAFDERLELLLGLLDGGGVEELAEVGIAEQFAELVLIDGQRLGAALGQRSIAVIYIIGDVTKEQSSGKGRG